MKSKPVVYLIRNLRTGWAYVGSTRDHLKRLSVHRRLLQRGIHWSKKLQASWKKHGEECFVLEVVEIVEDPNFLLMSAKWADPEYKAHVVQKIKDAWVRKAAQRAAA